MLQDTDMIGNFWNTWSERPAEMVCLPAGVRVTPVLYSSQARKAITPAAQDMRFGAHGPSGGPVAFETAHGGTRIGFRLASRDPWSVTGEWAAQKAQEWGLRYWVTLCLSAEGGAEARFDAETGAAHIRLGRQHVTLLTGAAPVLVTGHDSLDELIADFDANGYFHLGNRADSGKVIALRFNLEMMPTLRFAATVADDKALSLDAARKALREPPASAPVLHEGVDAGALDAVRDVIGWNTLYDQINRRRYTAISRIWNLGDFAVWFNDQTFAALMAGLFDAELARDNFRVALANATPQGNFACLVTSRDAWVDRSQPPHGALMVWLSFLRSRDAGLLRMAYPALARNHRWWRAHRDPDGIGLVSCGTSDVGQALYQGTAFAARNETGMDNSATHDEAVYDPRTRSLSTIDLGLNCALALDAEMLALIARELGHDRDAAAFDRLADDTRARIRTELWDEARGIFANRQRGGGFVQSLAPTSFYPLLCGAASADQAARLLDHLADPQMFGGPFMIPNTARSEPAFAENVYWRGRIWANVNYFVWQGLRRYGFDGAANDLAAKSLAMFNQSWRDDRLCGENYNAETGRITDQGDADPFYTWGAMLPLMAVSGIMDVSAWHGWEIRNPGDDTRLGPILSPVGEVVVSVEGGILTLSRGGQLLWSTDYAGPLRHIVMERGLCSLRLGQDCDRALLRPGADMAARLVQVRVDGAPVAMADGALDLSGLRAGARIDMYLTLPE
ncbi:MGH1-like glycoside hydrolase domain-containing protein [Paracoccus sp. (in: a-proteobacteria)]|uniref:MGH1-like glycoside hydrolase domain-containing protein n=1 Tax=Paracoccus sp. TaxID=267 RepID=UPI003A868F62